MMTAGGFGLLHLLRAGGQPSRARLLRCRAQADRVLRLAHDLESQSDDDLRRRALELRWTAKSGAATDTYVGEAFALVHQACRRRLGLTPFPVQVTGALGLIDGGVVEMQTGEGKTLTALMPTFARALPGKGCHVVTVNDYLAARDAEWSRPAFEMLGLTVGCVQSSTPPEGRKAEYACDVTYATAKELGFDFLRDRLQRDAAGGKSNAPGVVQRGTYFALLDEADSVLIDDARTPLIIALEQPPDPPTVELCRWGAQVAAQLELQTDFLFDRRQRNASLTVAGCRRVLLLGSPPALNIFDADELYRQVERALAARFAFARDRDYALVEDKVVIVDESTGRMMDGRKWQDGLHQAVEAKESLPISAQTQSAAQITVQRFFREYEHLAGMTGTAVPVARELKRTYSLRVTAIPTHRPCLRRGLPPRLFATLDAKLGAVADEICSLVLAGRAVLVGTPSIAASERLGDLLRERKVARLVLNARFDKEEADIVSQAGQRGRVTIATNMAGRGTDIKLHPEVAAHGGLHVIATEMHSSARIDRQLIGRAARQGDPGTFQFFLSLEDELFFCLPPERLRKMRGLARPDTNGELPTKWLTVFRMTQRLLERQHAKQRRQMLQAEQKRIETCESMGLDPYLEMTE